MAVNSKMVKPVTQGLLHLTVVRTERLSPHWMRVTLGGPDIAKFSPMGFDQWFRLFLPVGGGEGLDRLPAKANTMFGYLRYLRIPEGMRPVMRNYTVRAFRPVTSDAGADRSAELDVDFVLHGSAEDGTAGPASAWAETCEPGESVVIIDEGLTFNPSRGVDTVVLVADETALPAIAGICASLPATATGLAIVEVPSQADRIEFARPAGVRVTWAVRGDSHAKPGELALQTLRESVLPEGRYHGFSAGEQALATGARRHLVSERGADKDQVSFCGYWRSSHGPGRTTEPGRVQGAQR